MLYFKFWLADWESSRIKRRASREAVGLFLGDILPRLYTSPDPGYYCEVDGDGIQYLTIDEIADDLAQRGDTAAHVAGLLAELVKYRGLVTDEKGIHNPKAVEVASELAAKSQQASDAAKKRWDEKKRNADAMRTDSGRNADASIPHMQLELESELELKTETETETENTECVPAREEIGSVIAHWKEAWNKPHYPDSMTEQIAISNALRQGWTVDQLKACIEGYKLDPWPKRAQFSGLRYLLEDGDKIQRGIDFCGEKQAEVVDDGYEAWKADVIDVALESGEDIDYDDPPWRRSRWEERGQGVRYKIHLYERGK